MEARALGEAMTYPAALRVAEKDDGVYIDLGDDDWSALRITPSGWSIIPQAPVPILRSKRTAPFPMPAPHGDFGPLLRLLSHLDEDTRILLVAWCLGALMPRGPYPILVLGGEQGCGKSTLARLAQRLTDPTKGDLLQPPGNDRDLIAYAKTNRVLAFDNLSGIKPDLADSMCRLATGSEIGGRAMFSDHDTASFAASRPLIINGIPDLAARADLADRSIVLRLTALPHRMTQRDWEERVDEVLPATLVGLLDAMSVGLSSLKTTPTPDVRMADFARLVTAAEPALPWDHGRFLDAYRRSRVDADVALLDGDPVARAVRDFIATRPRWRGLVSWLYEELSKSGATYMRRPTDWPANPRWFGDRLRRAAPLLRAHGMDYEERRTAHGMEITLCRLRSLATLEPRDVANGANASRSCPTKPHIIRRNT